MTITFPTLHGKFAAFLYLMTLLCVGLIAWAQVDMALTTSDQDRRLRHQQCSGTVYGGEDYTSEERDEYEELCGHPLRTDKK
ncbi:hypothetical protein [Streptomyces sp. NPDC005533]|uniref:hypothetical protein n=1 Tax=Streptomyces sp. NPDC005533 TaxID=3364723 RepID=UPI00368371D3